MERVSEADPHVEVLPRSITHLVGLHPNRADSSQIDAVVGLTLLQSFRFLLAADYRNH